MFSVHTGKYLVGTRCFGVETIWCALEMLEQDKQEAFDSDKMMDE